MDGLAGASAASGGHGWVPIIPRRSYKRRERKEKGIPYRSISTQLNYTAAAEGGFVPEMLLDWLEWNGRA